MISSDSKSVDDDSVERGNNDKEPHFRLIRGV